jgi:hypothetical protein
MFSFWPKRPTIASKPSSTSASTSASKPSSTSASKSSSTSASTSATELSSTSATELSSTSASTTKELNEEQVKKLNDLNKLSAQEVEFYTGFEKMEVKFENNSIEMKDLIESFSKWFHVFMEMTKITESLMRDFDVSFKVDYPGDPYSDMKAKTNNGFDFLKMKIIQDKLDKVNPRIQFLRDTPNMQIGPAEILHFYNLIKSDKYKLEYKGNNFHLIVKGGRNRRSIRRGRKSLRYGNNKHKSRRNRNRRNRKY